jgi:transposase-like protein
LVVDQQYSIQEAATAVEVGHSTMDKWVRQLRDERRGVTLNQIAMTPEHPRIKELEKKLRQIEEHTQIQKKGHSFLDVGLSEQLKVVDAQWEPLSRYRATGFMKRLCPLPLS